MKILLSTVLLTFLIGCTPIKQYNVEGAKECEYLGLHTDFILIQLGQTQTKKSIHIIEDESYVFDPNGRKYSIKIIEHDYDIEQNHTYIRDRAYLFDDYKDQLTKYENGTWLIYLMVESGIKKTLRKFDMEVSTSYYIPLITRPN